MKPPLGCTNGALWVALARMLDEELTSSVSVSESQVNKCRAWLLAEFLRSELECDSPNCDHNHNRVVQLILAARAICERMDLELDFNERVH